jgi:capsule polysaccharide modification protein KpsS
VILLSLQRFDSPLFRTQANFKDQIEYIKYVLDNVDNNIAVIVTEHKKDRILGFEVIYDYFKNNYKNFIYWTETSNINNSSQFLLDLVDGVITISSTVGLQALLHKKPLFVPSNISYLTTFCDGQDLSKIADFLTNNQYKNKDSALYYLITRYYVVGKYYKDGKWLYNFLANSLESFRNKPNFSFYNKIDDDNSLLETICQQKYVDNLESKNSNKVIQRLKNSMSKRIKKFKTK